MRVTCRCARLMIRLNLDHRRVVRIAGLPQARLCHPGERQILRKADHEFFALPSAASNSGRPRGCRRVLLIIARDT